MYNISFVSMFADIKKLIKLKQLGFYLKLEVHGLISKYCFYLRKYLRVRLPEEFVPLLVLNVCAFRVVRIRSFPKRTACCPPVGWVFPQEHVQFRPGVH